MQTWECVEDTHKENIPSNTTQAVMGCINLDILKTGTLNELFVRGPYTQIIFLKKLLMAKLRSLWKAFSLLPILFVWTLALDEQVLYENVGL